MRFWLSDATTTLDLGDYIHTLNIGGNTRNFSVEQFARSNGGYLKGVGNYSPKEFTFSRDDFIVNSTWTDNHAWNIDRNTFMRWFTKPASTYIYLNMNYSSDAITLRTKVYPIELPNDNFSKNWNTDFDRSFKLLSPTGVWESSSNSTASVSITSTAEQEVTFTLKGIIEVNPSFYFTPIANCGLFQVKVSEGYGFRLEGTFLAGELLEYNMQNGLFYIAGSETDVTNYLTAGSPFTIPIISTSVFVYASSGVFAYSYKERYV